MDEKDQPQPLDYRRAADDRRPLSDRILAGIGGAALSTAAVTFLATVWVIANLNLGAPPPPPPAPQPPPARLVWKGPAIITLVGMATVLGLAFVTQRRLRWRWFSAGLLIGLILAALVEGLCFHVNGV